MGQDKAGFVAEKRKALGGEGLAVYLVMLSEMDFDNKILISQGEIGRRLNMTKQVVSRSIKRLIEIDAIHPYKTVGRVVYYQLNDEFGWKGKARDHQKRLQVA